MKKILFVCGVVIIILMNLYTTKSNNSFNEFLPKIQMFENASASGGSNCWSQTQYQEGSSVLRCVVCTYKENSIGVGRHDGKCPDNPV